MILSAAHRATSSSAPMGPSCSVEAAVEGSRGLLNERSDTNIRFRLAHARRLTLPSFVARFAIENKVPVAPKQTVKRPV